MKTIPGKTEKDAAICYVDNKIVVQKGGLSGAGTAAAGWLLFGPAGELVGSLAGRKALKQEIKDESYSHIKSG
jgi:hypothetical protein